MRVAARRQVRSVLSDVDRHIPVPWDIEQLVDRLAVHRGRPIRLVAWDFPAGGGAASGLWLPSARTDYVFYDRAASPTRREQIIGHELGHLLLGHTAHLGNAPAGLIEALAPSLSPELARRFLARTGYQVEEEATAEEFGTRLVRLGTSKRRPGGPDELGRLTDALR